jgi:HD-GYP domain-containing protein (c-di-GMP phosphodiesterase class II)
MTTSALDRQLERQKQLNGIGIALSRERNIDSLLETILNAAKEITHADGGTLYRLSDDGSALRFTIIRNDSLNIAMGGTTGTPINFPDVPLRNESGEPNNAAVAAYAAIHDRTVNIVDAYNAPGFDFSGTRKFDERTGYRSMSFLTVPMKNHENEIIGVLQLINARQPENQSVIAFSSEDQELAESLASQAAIALTNRLLINQLEELFEAFIGMLNTAIDEKSPYTGGHCQRVPELTLMIADALDQDQKGPLAGFHMSEKDRYELKIAGMLHDCGKVTTPVHVVDKATKLETIVDRIHLLDTRFEVLKRDTEIRALNKMLSLSANRQSEIESIGTTLQNELAALEQDRDFLRRANRGGEAMSDEDIARIHSLSRKYRWQGPDGRETDFLSPNELENLTIRAGTLTAAEREVINYHIVATIKMLKRLPWPRHLLRVPEYAGGHHERMDGKGYPNGLKREQMSIPARIMGIADIFEALTAADRPYKPPMKISQALQILGKFSAGGHIDPDIFAVFVRQKVYLAYAQKYLNASQIDAVDEGSLPGLAAEALLR